VSLAVGEQGRQEGIVLALKEITQQTSSWRYSTEVAVCKTPGVFGKEIYLLISGPVLEGRGSLGNFSRKKGTSRHHFPHLLSSLDTQTPTYGNQYSTKIP